MSILKTNAYIKNFATVVGKKEHDGPLGSEFDIHDNKSRFGQKTWEKAESEMQRIAMNTLLSKENLTVSDIDFMFAGDLLNQCIGSSYGLLSFDIPYFGLYGACSTAAESLILASVFISGGFANKIATITSSHFCSAERQYRTPLEYGGQRSPTSQWTVTGSGAYLVSSEKQNSYAEICEVFPSIVIDKGINDSANMGAGMAPAVIDTLERYFAESGKSPSDFDAIITGDLGIEGSSIVKDLLQVDGIDLCNHFDCGSLIYDQKNQDTHSGGSGCGCSAIVFASHFLPKIKSGELKDVLFLGTGAMMSPSSLKQGQSIPAVAHLLRIKHFESEENV